MTFYICVCWGGRKKGGLGKVGGAAGDGGATGGGAMAPHGAPLGAHRGLMGVGDPTNSRSTAPQAVDEAFFSSCMHFDAF